jgi:hypothetical protein
MVTPSVVVRMNTRFAVPSSVPDEPLATPRHSCGAAGPEADGATARSAPDDVPSRVGDCEPAARAANGPGEAAASPK